MAEAVAVTASLPARGVEVALEVPAGMTTAVIGPNGAGKSTLVGLIAGGVRPEVGRVLLGAETVDDGRRHVPAHRRRVAVLDQRASLFPHLSVLENVAFGPRAHGVGGSAALDRARAELDAVGCLDLAGRRPRTLSGGQAQRVALARALAVDPRVLLLDEPFAALDAEASARLRQVVAERLQGRTCVLVTHEPLDVWTLAAQVVVMESGRVADTGAPAEVLGRPATDFVARFAGLSVLRGEAAADTVVTPGGLVVAGLPAPGWAGRGPGLATIAPEAVSLYRGEQAPEGSPRNRWEARVHTLTGQGRLVHVVLTLTDGSVLSAALTPAGASALGLAPGVSCWASVKATQVALHTSTRMRG